MAMVRVEAQLGVMPVIMPDGTTVAGDLFGAVSVDTERLAVTGLMDGQVET